MLTKVAAAIVVIGLIIYGILFFLNMQSASTSASAASSYKTTTVTVGTTTIAVKIADTDALRDQGLSDTPSLAPGQGMLFVFQEPGNYPFWMKEMNYSLDILWANASGTITTIYPDLSPQTYPNSYTSATNDTLYVLEVPAGYAAEQNIKVGDQMQIGQ